MASGGVGPIDLQFFYTPDKVYSMVSAYGESGRASYRLFELTGDIIYPIIYTLFLACLLPGYSSDDIQRHRHPRERLREAGALAGIVGF